jgi:hypothetical protein
VAGREEMTVGELLDYIEKNNISRDAMVYMEMVSPDAPCFQSNQVRKNQAFHNAEDWYTYYRVWCPLKYKDDENLYLDLNY